MSTFELTIRFRIVVCLLLLFVVELHAFKGRRACLLALSHPVLFVPDAFALTPKEAERRYNAYAKTYNQLDGQATSSNALGIASARARLMQQATGHVLEIGVGTGLNLEYYQKSKLKSLTLVDVSDGMLQEARKRGVDLQLTAKFRKADATTELVSIFGEAAFDTVVDTFSLCVMGDEGAKQCLDQLASVVKPGTGKLLLLENSRSSNSILGMYQDVTANAAATMGGKGCVYNQNVAAMIHSTGRLRIEATEQYSAGLFRAFECTRIL